MLVDILIAIVIVVIAAVLGIVVHPLLWIVIIVAVLWLFFRRGRCSGADGSLGVLFIAPTVSRISALTLLNRNNDCPLRTDPMARGRMAAARPEATAKRTVGGESLRWGEPQCGRIGFDVHLESVERSHENRLMVTKWHRDIGDWAGELGTGYKSRCSAWTSDKTSFRVECPLRG